MFHNVLRVFCDVLQLVHDVLQVVHDVLLEVHDVLRVFRFEKSNSVTHLRSYTNGNIARNFTRPPMSPHRAPILLHRMVSVPVLRDVLSVS